MKVLIQLTFLFIILSFPTLAEEIKVFEFSQEELDSLEIRKVRGADAKTEYSVGKNDNGNFLKAAANNAASSPPVPARTSRIAFFSSASSLGSKSI